MLHHVDRNGPTESPLRVCACLSSGGFVALILAAVFWPSESLVYVALPALRKIVAHTQEVAMEAKRKLDDQGRQNSAVDRLLTALNSFLMGHKSSHLVKIGSRSALGEAREQPPPATPAPDLSDHLIKCHSHGVYSPALDECRCTAGWNGRWCSVRMARRCNAAADGSILMRDSLCAGDCDEDRGSCYCAAADRSRRWSRPLPYTCAPAAHRKSKLPDGRPAYPVLAVSAETGVPRWKMANMYFESNKKSPHFDYTRSDQVPFEWIYGQVGSNPPSPGVDQQHAKVPFCTAPSTVHRQLTGCADGGCPEGRAGEYCEHPKQSFCLRDCSGHGWCDAGFCWCKAGWFGIDCSQHHTLPNARSLQEEQRLPSPAARHSKLRVYVYDMPSEFTTMLLQYRLGAGQGLSRMITSRNRSVHKSGSLYAMELAFHEWILDAPLRTTKSKEAHLFFVPIYLSSIFMWPVVKFADQPYYGASEQAPRHRSHQATLLMLRALSYIRRRYPFWNRRGGRDHIWMMLHDEGPCFCPREIRPSILLTHYGYHAINPRPWTTFFDDNFLADERFFLRHLSDEQRSQLTRCFDPQKDIAIPPWKTPSFWKRALQDPRLRPGVKLHRREGLVYFAGELGFNRLAGYSHDLRQKGFALFCNPKSTKRRDCTPVAYDKRCDCECRKDIPQNCSLWREGVTIKQHTSNYQEELSSYIFCVAWPGDGWSSRVVDALVHGCIPVVIQDDSFMFFEGMLNATGVGLDYEDFSVRIAEGDQHSLVERLTGISRLRVERMQRRVLWVRDYFVYKDMYNPNRNDRRKLLSSGRPGQDAFLMIAKALELRARALGIPVPQSAPLIARTTTTPV